MDLEVSFSISGSDSCTEPYDYYYDYVIILFLISQCKGEKTSKTSECVVLVVLTRYALPSRKKC